MSPKIDLNVHTQRRAYNAGFQAALALLVTVLEENGDVNYLIDALENNASPETAARLNAYYAARGR